MTTNYIQVLNDANHLQIDSNYVPLHLTRCGTLSEADAIIDSGSGHVGAVIPLQDGEYNAALRYVGTEPLEYTVITINDTEGRCVGISIVGGAAQLNNLEYYVYGFEQPEPMQSGDVGYEVYDEAGGIVANSKSKVAQIVYAKSGLACAESAMRESDEQLYLPNYIDDAVYTNWTDTEGYRYKDRAAIAVMCNMPPRMVWDFWSMGPLRYTGTIVDDGYTACRIKRSKREAWPIGDIRPFGGLRGYNLSYSVLYLDVSAYAIKAPPRVTKGYVRRDEDIDEVWTAPYDGNYMINGGEPIAMTAGSIYNVRIVVTPPLMRSSVTTLDEISIYSRAVPLSTPNADKIVFRRVQD